MKSERTKIKEKRCEIRYGFDAFIFGDSLNLVIYSFNTPTLKMEPIVAKDKSVRDIITANKQTLEDSLRSRDLKSEARACYDLSVNYFDIGELKGAVKYAVKGLMVAKLAKDLELKSRCYVMIGNIHDSYGNFPKAKELYLKSLKISRELNYRDGEKDSCISLGNSYTQLGKYDKAMEYYNKGLEIAKELNNRSDEGEVYTGFGGVLYCSSNFEEAVAQYEKGLQISEEVNNRALEAVIYCNLGMTYRSFGNDIDRSISFLKMGLALNQEIGLVHRVAKCHCELGSAYFASENYEETVNCHERALKMFKEIGDRQEEYRIYVELSKACLKLEEFDKAVEYYKEGRRVAPISSSEDYFSI